MKEDCEELLKLEWDESEREILTRLTSSLKFYKMLIPKDLKKDIIEAIKLCTRLKDALVKSKKIM